MSDEIKLNYDPVVTIATAARLDSKNWHNEQIKLSDLFARFRNCKLTSETQAEFLRLKSGSKTDKDRAKAIKACAGGFVGGQLDGTGRRQRENVVNRQLLTLDIDSGIKLFGLHSGISFARYTTHSHSDRSHRFRIVAPLSRPVSADEYERLSRLYVWEISDMLGVDPAAIFTDETTHLPEHMMFFPTASKDGPFDFDYQDGGPIDADAVLDTDREGFYLKRKGGSVQNVERAAGEKVPEGQRYTYLISKLGTLVNKLHQVCTDDAILLTLWQSAHDDCEGEIDGEDYDAFCEKYRGAVEQFRKGKESENYDYSAAVGKYFSANPGEDLPKKADGSTDWERVRQVADNHIENTVTTGSAENKTQKSSKGSSPTAKLSSDVVPLSSIEPVPTEWLVPGWIPKGTLTILGADGGTGKTAVVCNIISALVTGQQSILEGMEGKNPFEGRDTIKVMFFSSEDSFSHVLVQRLTNCGADLSNIVTIPASDERFREIRYDSEFLEQLIAVHRPGLVVFDPLQGFIDGTIHMGERNAMRQCLSPLLALGDKYGTTFLIVMHTNKQAGASGRKRFADSSDIYDLARSAIELGICVNELGAESGQPLRYISHAKSNYGALQKTILFDIPGGVAKFSATTDKTARDFILQEMRAPKEEKANTLRDDIKNEILEQLEDGEKPVSDVDAFLKALGHSNATIRRAKEDLKKAGKIRIYSTGYGDEKKFYVKLT